ncbi:MAG: hypothetical protein V7K27_20780 [Nostoc sp.]
MTPVEGEMNPPSTGFTVSHHQLRRYRTEFRSQESEFMLGILNEKADE